MAERSDKLLKEEVRGIFVLGVIGTLLALGRGLDVIVFSNVSLATLTNCLVLYWGIYVVLMAIGVSDDIVKPSITELCNTLAKVYFVGGLAVLMALSIVTVALYFLSVRGVLITWPIAIVVIVAGVVMLCLFTLGLHKKGSFFS